MNEQLYTITLTRPQIDLVVQGLCELPAKHVFGLLSQLQAEVAAADQLRVEMRQTPPRPPAPPPP